MSSRIALRWAPRFFECRNSSNKIQLSRSCRTSGTSRSVLRAIRDVERGAYPSPLLSVLWRDQIYPSCHECCVCSCGQGRRALVCRPSALGVGAWPSAGPFCGQELTPAIQVKTEIYSLEPEASLSIGKPSEGHLSAYYPSNPAPSDAEIDEVQAICDKAGVSTLNTRCAPDPSSTFLNPRAHFLNAQPRQDGRTEPHASHRVLVQGARPLLPFHARVHGPRLHTAPRSRRLRAPAHGGEQEPCPRGRVCRRREPPCDAARLQDQLRDGRH